MKILAIDTSCDDTCISLISVFANKNKTKNKFKILSNIVSSQVNLHKEYGGIFPSLAKREHQNNLTPVIKKALNASGLLSCRKKNHKNKNGLLLYIFFLSYLTGELRGDFAVVTSFLIFNLVFLLIALNYITVKNTHKTNKATC